MLKNFFFALVFILSSVVFNFAQETRPTPSPTRARPTAPRPSNTPSLPQTTQTTPQITAPRTTQEGGGTTQYARERGRSVTPTERAVRAAFEQLINGIRQTDVDAVMNVYSNSPRLSLFNNNGTVTRGWEQVRANRESSYPNYEDVTLDVRDARVSVLGQGGALVTCLWTQAQTFRGVPETASGRLTIVFQLISGEWKAVHTHTSPDAPDPSRVLPSERTTTAPTTTPPPDDPQS